MTPLLGRLLILGSLLAAVSGTVVAFGAAKTRSRVGTLWAKRLAYGYAALIIGANLVMIYALVANDFSVSYVAQVGSIALPLWVKVVSLWSSLEGSILFWGMVLGLYIAIATATMGDRYPEYLPGSIGVWLACGVFFSFLIAGPAQPFGTVPNPPADGPGPNPLLQNHILMAVHPPFLYLGYVGMTIPFGLVSAALLRGKLGADFLRPVRTWTLVPWAFQSVAIVLGGWWAYEVLGWGGYWAWDPVENASFLPWLTATAALHSIIVTKRKGTLKGWTSTLVLSTFLLTILGTFMTRSGVFNSVHSFTQSAIGPTILAFFSVALLWSIVLLASRIDVLDSNREIGAPASREGMFLVNNLLFVLFTLTVLVGTVFPLVVEALTERQISVGRPYFDRMSIPIGAALLLLMGIGPALPWGRATKEQMKKALLPPLAGAAVLLTAGLAFGARNPWTLLTLAFAGYTLQVTMREMWRPFVQRVRRLGESPVTAFLEAQVKRGRRRFGSYIVHFSVVLIFVAIAVSSTMQVNEEFQLDRNESATIGEYTLTFLGARDLQEPHRESIVAEIAVAKNDRRIATLHPRMNYYERQREPIGTPSVRTSIEEDLYLSIMNVDPMRQTLGLRAMINPMVGWIWFATGLLAFGALVTLVQPRRVVEASTRTSDEKVSSRRAPRVDAGSLGSKAGEGV